MNKKEELAVFTYAKQVSEYIIEATVKAPKFYRHSLLKEILASSTQIIRQLYLANRIKEQSKRLDIQLEIDSEIQVFSHFSVLCERSQILTKSQFEHLSKITLLTRRSLWSWIKSNPAYNGDKK